MVTYVFTKRYITLSGALLSVTNHVDGRDPIFSNVVDL